MPAALPDSTPEPRAGPLLEPPRPRRDPLAGPLRLLASLVIVLVVVVEFARLFVPDRAEIDERVQDVTMNVASVDTENASAVVFLVDTWSGWPRAHGDLMAQALLGTCPSDVAVARVDLGATIDERSIEQVLQRLLEFARQERTLPIVVNMSFGGGHASEVERQLARELAAEGVVLVAAAGNDGTSAPFFPAALPEVLAVGNSSRLGRVSSSNFGDWVDCYLDGYFNTALRPGGESTPSGKTLHYSIETGTSFSAARVSGLMAAVVDGRRLAPEAALNELLTAADIERGGTISQWRVRWACDRGWRRDALLLAATIVAGLLLLRWLFARPTTRSVAGEASVGDESAPDRSASATATSPAISLPPKLRVELLRCAAGLRGGQLSVAQIVAWADALAARAVSPPDWLIELTLAGRSTPADVAALLERVVEGAAAPR
ncbi:MAG: hypothetical protein EXS13_05585 [Planctomycetes bacterium]|nr:hypothetical protein [Planctomycetota bacterium]